MKHLKLILATLIALTLPCVAYAEEPTVISGSLNGMVFQNHIDTDGDGFNGRSGKLDVHGSEFTSAFTHIDTTIDFSNPQGGCDPGELEIIPSGVVVFASSNGKSAVFAQINSAIPLCFGVVAEEVHLIIVGGRGDYAGATGTGTVLLPDDTVFAIDPLSGVPLIAYAHDGSFELTIN